MALPNGPMEIVFSFDTTGSMCGCINEVKGYVQDMVQRLQADIAGIKMAVLAHGDYCDAHTYVTKFEDFTDDVARLCNFVKTVKGTGGGDADECYELVLHQVRTELSWTPESQRALVMIGDCNPHGVDYPQNTLKLDWEKETEALRDEGVRIYSVQCNGITESDHFYKTIAEKTGGRHLKLSEFRNIFDFIMAICYREKGVDFLDNYEKEVRARGAGVVNKDLHHLFGDLRDASSATPPTPVTTTPKTKVTKPKVTLKKVASATKLTKAPVLKKMKSAKKVPNSLKAFTVKELPRLRRENVPKTNFMLKDMPWSQWERVMRPNDGFISYMSGWKARAGDDCGFRVNQIFGGHMDVPALYEIAVQTKWRARKIVVYSKSCKGFSNKGGVWEKKLLGKACIKNQIDDVLRQKCSVFIRRVVINGQKMDKKIRPALSRYDYAWSGHRDIVKGEVNISSTAMEL